MGHKVGDCHSYASNKTGDRWAALWKVWDCRYNQAQATAIRHALRPFVVSASASRPDDDW
ncbi:hypothetical protein IMCC12053_2829 [Celeribacter marinus]|uniref:Uncharacterized protein n=1 Tax=Celeribacter marinus TaxID=1397108 RepID=A0A0N9ZSE0_9RHOB|nr:hypothetical protein IMCC12053_2829 [Celeribacter marinus]